MGLVTIVRRKAVT